MINLLDLSVTGNYNSGYGYRGDIGVDGASSWHRGVDLTLKTDNVPAVVGGTVVGKGFGASSGNWITIQQNDGLIATYMHLAKLPSLSNGDTVTEGQTIGVQGSTGASSGKHLHYQVKDNNGNWVNTEDYLSGAYYSGLTDGGTVATPVGSDTGESWKATAIRVVAYLLIIAGAAYFFFTAFDIKLL